MNTYEITSKSDDAVPRAVVYRYSAAAPIEWQGMEFATHDHTDVSASVSQPVVAAAMPYDSLIDVGAYLDRFGAAKMPILMSTHPVVQAIYKDVQVRKWVDLKRPEVAQANAALAAYVPEFTPTIRAGMLKLPVLPDENLALRTTYFSELIHG